VTGLKPWRSKHSTALYLLLTMGFALALSVLLLAPVRAARPGTVPLQPSPRPPWYATETPTPQPTPRPTSRPAQQPPPPPPTPTATPIPDVLPATGGFSHADCLVALGAGAILSALFLVIAGKLLRGSDLQA